MLHLRYAFKLLLEVLSQCHSSEPFTLTPWEPTCSSMVFSAQCVHGWTCNVWQEQTGNTKPCQTRNGTCFQVLRVGPHKAAAEVAKIGNWRKNWLVGVPMTEWQMVAMSMCDSICLVVFCLSVCLPEYHTNYSSVHLPTTYLSDYLRDYLAVYLSICLDFWLTDLAASEKKSLTPEFPWMTGSTPMTFWSSYSLHPPRSNICKRNKTVPMWWQNLVTKSKNNLDTQPPNSPVCRTSPGKYLGGSCHCAARADQRTEPRTLHMDVWGIGYRQTKAKNTRTQTHAHYTHTWRMCIHSLKASHNRVGLHFPRNQVVWFICRLRIIQIQWDRAWLPENPKANQCLCCMLCHLLLRSLASSTKGQRSHRPNAESSHASIVSQKALSLVSCSYMNQTKTKKWRQNDGGHKEPLQTLGSQGQETIGSWKSSKSCRRWVVLWRRRFQRQS